MKHTIRWPDGVTWQADDAAFDAVTAALASVTDVIEGLAPVLARWRAEALRGATLEVDVFVPTEADRAVLTAGLARAVEVMQEAPPAEGQAAAVTAARRLHELFVTDVTKS